MIGELGLRQLKEILNSMIMAQSLGFELEFIVNVVLLFVYGGGHEDRTTVYALCVDREYAAAAEADAE